MELLIKGIKIANTTYKIGQYADDTFLLLDGSEESVRQSMVIFKCFYLCSGLKLNFMDRSNGQLGHCSVPRDKNDFVK